MKIIKNHLPSFCYSRNKIKSVDGAVVHFVSAVRDFPDDPFNLDAIMGIFKKYEVSAKYLIRRNGDIIELVPDLHKSHHAGYSRMNGRDRCNDWTIGIELEGGSDFPYTDEQMASLGELLAHLMTDHKFTLDYIKGHDEVRSNWLEKYPEKAKEKKVPKKVDPGDHFSWPELREMLSGVSAQIEHDQKLG